MKLVCGNSNRSLASNIGKYLDTTLADCDVKKFADKEIFVEMNENVRGEDVFIIQSISFPANDNLMELLILIDTMKRASAKRITAVVPYYGYARQDRKSGPRTPISAKLVANLIEKAGANRVLSMDFHAGQIQGFFDIPTDNLFSAPILTHDIKKKIKGNDSIVVSPDAGGVERARTIASRIESDLAIVDKRREKAGVSEVMNIIGEVKKRSCFIVDDIVDSAGTLCNAAQALMNSGAVEVYAYVTHGVLSGEAIERVNNSSLKKLIITDTIEESEEVKNSKKIETVSVVPLLGEAIKRISEERSVSSLFD
ncbi:MAG: phosphoribosylpyrophosphate synthetase [Rhodobiaceae bacterium]|nr:phosphoribosylpyrophosphate synthetase [Rhodobiaceae bacterium]